MSKVRALRPQAELDVAAAVEAFLDARCGHPEQASTRRAYSVTLRALASRFPGELSALDSNDLATWFQERWADAKPATWNRHLDALRSAIGYWRETEWLHTDPSARIARRKLAPDRSRALSRAEVEELLTRPDVDLREKLLWRMLYESAARAHEVLNLDVEDIKLANKSARVKRKGGAVDMIAWRDRTARLLPRYLKGRKTGPLFRTKRGGERLSYRRAAELFTKASGGATLHQLRHSALTHAAEDGASTPLLMSYSGHTNPRTLQKYARVSAEALQRWQNERDRLERRR